MQLNTARRIITNSRTLVLQHPNIPHPVERWLWVLERKLNNDSLYWQTKANQYHMSGKVFFEASTWIVSNVYRAIWNRLFICALSIFLFTLHWEPQSLFPFPRLMWATTPYRPCTLSGEGVNFFFFFSGQGGEDDASGGVDVVNPFFTAAQYGRVTFQPVANIIHLRCSSFLPHLAHLT